MIPITVLTDCDLYLKTADPRAAYDAILKSGLSRRDRAPYVTHDQIDKSRDTMSQALKPLCRPKIQEEKPDARLDREKLKKDLEKDFDEITRPLRAPIPK